MLFHLEETVFGLVQTYCAKHRHPELTAFIVHAIQPWKGWWKSKQSYRPGCYLIYSKDGELMYIGKASFKATMGSRIGWHEKDRHPKWLDAAFVQMIEVHEPFEAPSLEEYLLSHVSTRLNKIGFRSVKPPEVSQPN